MAKTSTSRTQKPRQRRWFATARRRCELLRSQVIQDPAELELALRDLHVALAVIDELISPTTMQALAELELGRLSDKTAADLEREMTASQERLA